MFRAEVVRSTKFRHNSQFSPGSAGVNIANIFDSLPSLTMECDSDSTIQEEAIVAKKVRLQVTLTAEDGHR